MDEATDRKVAREEAASLLRLLGVDVNDQDSVNEFRDDWSHARQSRLAARERTKSIMRVILTAISGAATGSFLTWWQSGRPH